MQPASRARRPRGGMSRREFARAAALTAATAAVLPRDLLAQPAAPAPQDSASARPPAAAGAAKEPALPAASRAEAEARIEAVLRRRGDRLDEAQKAEVRRSILGSQQGLDRLRAFPLGNADEPATVLHLHRPETS